MIGRAGGRSKRRPCRLIVVAATAVACVAVVVSTVARLVLLWSLLLWLAAVASELKI